MGPLLKEAPVQADAIRQKIQRLNDLELVILLGLVANEPCLVQTQPEAIDATFAAIELITTQTFGLRAKRVECNGSTTVDEFGQGLLIPTEPDSRLSSALPSFRRSSYESNNDLNEAGKTVANVVVANNLSDASDTVQMQALELIRTRRIFSHSTVHTTPSAFLFLTLTSESSRPLANHLNDLMLISHFHNAEEPLDDDKSTEQSEIYQDGKSLQRMPKEVPSSNAIVPKADIEFLKQRRNEVNVTVEMKRYLYNLLVFLRMHRAVAGGITAKASRDFEDVTKCLASLNDLSFVTPSIIALAFRKVYRHRTQLATVSQERSMQYGSDAAEVAKVLEGLTPEIVIEQVLQEVEVPL